MRTRAAGALAPRVMLGVLAGGGLVLGWDLAAAPPAGAVPVSNEAELRAAFADPAETVITLTADITLTDCVEEDVGRTSAVALTVDGAGHTIDQSCAGASSRIFSQQSTGALTFTNIVLALGSTQGDGGAIRSQAPVTVVSSTFNGNFANGVGGAIAAPTLTVVDSTFTGNIANGSGGALIAGAGAHVVTGSIFANNSASALGGAILLEGAASSLTVTNSDFSANTATSGGAIWAPSAPPGINVTNSTFTGNAAIGDATDGGRGGAIRAVVVSVTGSTLTGNTAPGPDGAGGAIEVASSLQLIDSLVTGNSAGGAGGGLAPYSATVTGSTISNNTARVGGAISAISSVSVTNSTVTGNMASEGVGGVVAFDVELTYATVVGNSGPEAANVVAAAYIPPAPLPGPFESFASVVALPGAGPNCNLYGGTPESTQHNFSDDDSCGFTDPTDVQNGGDPQLGPLADNGGPTPTRLPAPGSSPLVDTIPLDACPDIPSTDQRGVGRPSGPACDIGAVEVQNVPPIADNDTATVLEDSTANPIPVLANDFDPEGTDLVITEVTQGANGTVVITGGGTGLTYEPAPDFPPINTPATDDFTYTVTDAGGASDTATVTVTVDPVNDAPGATDDSYTTAEDTTLVIPAPGVLGNDADPEGESLTATLDTGPALGTVALNGDGAFTYTPDAEASGDDVFTYTVSDASGTSDTATVTIAVAPVNDSPVAVADTFSTSEDVPLAGAVLGNDTDVEGDALTAAMDQPADNGDVALSPDGTFTYTPEPGFFGTDGFTYIATDGEGASATATVTITVVEVPPPPGGYVPMTPVRLADTRDGTGVPAGPIPAGGVLEIPVAGRHGIPADATGIVANLTAADPVAAGYLAAFPCGTPQPYASSVNHELAPVPGLISVGLGGGSVCVFSFAETDVLLDVVGWFAPGGLRFSARTPERIADTRDGSGGVQAGLLQPGVELVVPVPVGAAAASINVTVTEPAAAGYLTLQPCGTTPNVSNLNYVGGQTVANAAVVPAGAGGAVCVTTSQPTHVAIDLTGTFGTQGALFQPTGPARLADTRVGTGAAPVPAGGTLEVQAVPPAQAAVTKGVVVNLTGVNALADGFLTAHPCGTAPYASNVNYLAAGFGRATSNAAFVATDSQGRVCVTTSATVDIVVDLTATFTV